MRLLGFGSTVRDVEKLLYKTQQITTVLTLAAQLSRSPFVFCWSQALQFFPSVYPLVSSTREALLEVERSFDYLKWKRTPFNTT